MGIGIVGFLGGYLIKPSFLRKLSVPFLLLSIIFLAAVFIPGLGIEHGGSYRWISFRGVSFQPSEIGKLALLFYVASWLASHKKEITSLTKGFLPFLALTIPIPFLILLEPNLSNFGICALLIVMLLFIGGARVLHLTSLVFITILLFFGVLLFLPNRLERVLTFLNPHIDPQGASFQINQSLIAIGSGGITGKGLGESIQKTGFLPEPSGDSIFAIVSEEFGFLGSAFLVGIYLLLVLEGIIIARRNKDQFSQYIAIGFSSLVALQAFINISAVIALLPLTGVTLPFISYGGTSLATFLGASGVVARIAKRAS